MDPELARRARERLTRMDPAAVQQRKGGRPASAAFVLRGVLFCACGAPMYTSQKGPRAYVCRDVAQCTGLCTRPRIPAQVIEGHVLRHLDAFVGKDLEAWIVERLATRTDEHAALQDTLDARRSELAALERRREQRMAELDEIGITKIGIELIERIDAEREAVSATVADIEARLSEWSGGPSSDAILDYYCSIRDAVTGRITSAHGPSDVAAVLADVFEGIWVELAEPEFVPLMPGERSLRAEFVLRRPIDSLGWLPAGQRIRDDDPIAVLPGIERDPLPPLPKHDAGGWSSVRFGASRFRRSSRRSRGELRSPWAPVERPAPAAGARPLPAPSAGGLLHAIDREHIDQAPVPEHVREYLRAAFRLHDACQTAANQRAAAGAARRPSVPPAAETARDGNLLAWRAAQAMSRDERVRVRTHAGAEHIGRIVRWSPTRGPAELELDGGQVLAIADVKVIATAHRVGRDRRDRRLAACAHAFGYRGHCLSKSRRYSTTFTALRQAREAYMHAQLLARPNDATQRTVADTDPSKRVASFRYVGQGHLTAADALLAASAAARAREARRLACEERRTDDRAVSTSREEGRP